MDIAEHTRFTLRGFSAKRVGYIAAVMGFAFVPAHLYVSCEVSEMFVMFSTMLFLLTTGLSLVVHRGTPNRFRPLTIALVATVANMLTAH